MTPTATLAGIPTRRPGWQDHAACHGHGNQAFFRTRGHTITQARTICATCPVQTPCRQYAIGTHQRFGVWGGLRATDLRPSRLPTALTEWAAWQAHYLATGCTEADEHDCAECEDCA